MTDRRDEDQAARAARVARELNESKAKLDLRSAADVDRRAIRWLWPERIARGKLSMLAGHPGLGKSQLSLSIAAIVSTGRPWPDGSQTSSGHVLLLSAEDDAEDTIRPRLEAADADLTHVTIIESVSQGFDANGDPKRRAFQLNQDERLVRDSIDRLPNLSLLIIDPISAYFSGNADSHNNAEVRAALAPIAALAAERDFAVLMISHLNKAGGMEALLRVTGSLAFVAAARAAYIVCSDPDDETGERRLFLSLKNNLSRIATGLAFNIEGRVLDANGHECVHTSRAVWSPEPVNRTANEAMSASSQDPNEREALREAEAFVRQELTNDDGSDKRVPSKQLMRAATDAGHSLRTVERARRNLGVQSIKEGDQWFCKLP